MGSVEAAEDADWQRQAKGLRKDIRSMISSHRREFNVGLSVEFAIVQDTRTTGTVGIGEPLFDCVHHLALSQLKPYGNELQLTKLWGGQVESCAGRICAFCTNLPPYAQLKLESSDKETRLLQIYRDVNRLFQEGKILIESMPKKLKELTACDLGEGQIRGAATKDPRLVAYTNGHEWLSTLFSASWRPDHPRSLSGERSTIVEKSPQMTREDANRFMEVPNPSSRVWESSGCFFDIRRNLFGDSIRLVDWLLSQFEVDTNTAANNATQKPAESMAVCEGIESRGQKANDKDSAVTRVRSVYEWAISTIPDADAMTIKEVFEAIQNHPKMTSDFLDRLPNNHSTFGTYLRRSGIERYNSQGDRVRRPSRRPKKRND